MVALLDLDSRLSKRPRIPYGSYPTPLEPLRNLTEYLGGPQLWIKRDDNLGPAIGGNKARKLEFLMADVKAKGVSRVVTYGGLQSNHARMTAAACAALDVEAHIFFFERRPAILRGNLFLDYLLGAKLHFVPVGGGSSAAFSLETTNRLVRLLSSLRLGPGAYFMPVGGHSPIGCLGYVRAAQEIHQQLEDLDIMKYPVTVVLPAGTGGTLAGLLAGFSLLDSPVKLVAIDVGKLWRSFPASIARLSEEICGELGRPTRFGAADIPIIEGRYVGPGYARMSAEAGKAIRTMARQEGILLDPVYSGKAFAGLLDLFHQGQFGPNEHVIFLHTGGQPGLWADTSPSTGQDNVTVPS